MSDRTCSVEGCDRKHRAKGLCAFHYQRARFAVPLDAPEFQPGTRCSVDGCERPHSAKGLCVTHYNRMRGGRSIDAPIRKFSEGCMVDGCERKHHANGYCSGHDRRARKGKPMEAPWLGEGGMSYRSAHNNVIAARGKATAHSCVDCGEAAAEWSYNHSGINERIGNSNERSVTYSLDADQYEARCIPCHRRFDAKRSPAA